MSVRAQNSFGTRIAHPRMAAMIKDRLFLLSAPFEDRPGEVWFCADCALMEGALLANPLWDRDITVIRDGFARPRETIVGILGDDHQGMPVLVFGSSSRATVNARKYGDYHFITDPKDITRYLAARYGGAGPHP